MIPHHHHEATAIDFSTIQKQQEANDHHHDDSHHHHDDTQDENKQKDTQNTHNHPFPFHQHILSSNDLIVERANLTESNTQNQNSVITIVLTVFQSSIFEPPKLSTKYYKDKSFLISSNYYPVANALRGPPSIV